MFLSLNLDLNVLHNIIVFKLWARILCTNKTLLNLVRSKSQAEGCCCHYRVNLHWWWKSTHCVSERFKSVLCWRAHLFTSIHWRQLCQDITVQALCALLRKPTVSRAQLLRLQTENATHAIKSPFHCTVMAAGKDILLWHSSVKTRAFCQSQSLTQSTKEVCVCRAVCGFSVWRWSPFTPQKLEKDQGNVVGLVCVCAG